MTTIGRDPGLKGNGADAGDGAVTIREKGPAELQASLRGVETRDNQYDGGHAVGSTGRVGEAGGAPGRN